MNTLNHTHDGPVDLQRWADPNDVLNDSALTMAQKRARLASWASDARAVPNFPAFRKLENGALVTIDSVLNALKHLDKLEGAPQAFDEDRDQPRKGHWSKLSRRWRKHWKDDDDDDPFSPAPAMTPPRSPVLDSTAAAAA